MDMSTLYHYLVSFTPAEASSPTQQSICMVDKKRAVIDG